MIFIYNIIIILYFIVTVPYYLLQMLRKDKYRAGLLQRFGRYPSSLRETGEPRRCIWLHAVSVGEVLAIVPFVKRLHAAMPAQRLVISTVTLTGQKVAREKLGDIATVTYFPLDIRFAVRRALAFFNPALIVLVETEIWPNFITMAHGKNIPILIINGRISDKSYRGYLSGAVFFKPLLRKIALFSVQTSLDAERLEHIGAAPAAIKVVGNMKFDCGLTAVGETERRQAALRAGIDPDRYIIVAGSTHKGEDEIIFNAFLAIKSRFPQTTLIIVPRHPERASDIKTIVEAGGERCSLKTEMHENASTGWDVLIVDTIGELVDFYRAATIVFVGKSLFPKGGGQNIIEPASLGKPVLCGPSMENFREAVALLLSNNAAVRVADGAALEAELIDLLGDEARRNELGKRAAQTMLASRGATETNVTYLQEFLQATGSHERSAGIPEGMDDKTA
jgi:3-deoxy-D-manno-octulosonic-acid transferase